MSLDEGLIFLASFMRLLVFLHINKMVHRDIKPENIILRTDPSDPVLLDFGQSYGDLDDCLFSTAADQELGNRFLRLPELSAWIPEKRDRRSDLAFAGGLLLYTLTQEPPAVLLDQNGIGPHQRVQDVLRAAAGDRFDQLMRFFDRALAHKVGMRFQMAEEMLEEVKKLARCHAGYP